MSASTGAVADVRENLDFAGQDLRDRDFSEASLVGANFTGADLSGAVFYEADLADAEFTGANLHGANLEHVKAARACFGNANLTGARLLEGELTGATLSGADLSHADLRNAKLKDARMVQCKLDGADLERANLSGASCRGSSCAHANFGRAKLAGACLRELVGAESAMWIEAEIQHVDFTGAYLLRRQILDQNYIHEFRNQGPAHRVVYWVWWATSDCGRSLLRWGVCTALLAIVFGLGFSVVDVDFGSSPTALSPFYFSLVTLTTLGYGDVLPVSMAAQLLVMLEVGMGYMMLGGMLSIFSDKMARRAG